MLEKSRSDGAPEARLDTRKNLFMAATLHAAGIATLVKIRDLSATGTQIESEPLPVGSAITLTRGALRVDGKVAWSSGHRCGLHFSSPISVSDWMANPVNREQGRVDHVVMAVKAGMAPPAATGPHRAPSAHEAEAVISAVAGLLEILGDALASDPAVVGKHGGPLQNLDIAQQTLMTLVETMHDGGTDKSASIARLAELRASCAEALRGEPRGGAPV